MLSLNSPVKPMLAGVTCFALLFPCLGEVGAQTAGVRHRIDATVSIDPSSPLIRIQAAATGSLSFSVRLSANSTESRYFGVLSPEFSNLALTGKHGQIVARTKIWEEDKCHQRRGLPKVTVMLLKGTFGDGTDRQDIWSVIRHIGLKVPADELTPGIKLPDGVDEIGRFYAFRARSRDSRLNIDLNIYSLYCRLD